MKIIKKEKIKKISAKFSLKPRAFSSLLVAFFSFGLLPGAYAQSVSVVKCEKDGVVSYQAVSSNMDKSCAKVSIAVDSVSVNSTRVRSSSGVSSGSSSSSSINYASKDSNNGGAVSNISNTTQKNRDIRRFELLAQELTNEQESLKNVEAQLAKTTDTAEIKKLMDQKIVAQNNVSSLKKELGKNDTPIVAAIKSTPVSVVAPKAEDNVVLKNVASKIGSANLAKTSEPPTVSLISGTENGTKDKDLVKGFFGK